MADEVRTARKTYLKKDDGKMPPDISEPLDEIRGLDAL
jgi:hypothetical protein